MSQSIPAANAPMLTDDAVVEAIGRHLLRLMRESDPSFDTPLARDSSFDALGLDSMTRVSLVQALEEDYAIELDPGLAFDFVTIDALAQYVRAQVNGEAIDEKKLLGI